MLISNNPPFTASATVSSLLCAPNRHLALLICDVIVRLDTHSNIVISLTVRPLASQYRTRI